MDFAYEDFNQAEEYFRADGLQQWEEIEEILREAPLFMQSSDQAGRIGSPIFDPKATNAYLCLESQERGWRVIPVPEELRSFGVDWDAGKGATLVEWQFSNYPFLWNNVIRSEAVHNSEIVLPGMHPIKALIIVTKSGLLPASNSTLYYEQGRAQLRTVTAFGAFSLPIRLVGLTIANRVSSVGAIWSEYANPRYDRTPLNQTHRTIQIRWRDQERQYGTPIASFQLQAQHQIE